VAERLGVFFAVQRVGTLEREPDGPLAFEYAPGWLEDPGAFAVSVSLPRKAGRAVGGAAHAFFANLLPEGQVREAVARRLGLSVSSDFALLRALGAECAGALSILPEPETPGTEQGSYEPLSERALAQMARSYSVLAEAAAHRGARLSLAGAQDKLPVHRDAAGRLSLPLDGAPSTHILKVPSRRFKHLPANEVLVTSLARALSLPTVEAELIRVEGVPIALVNRYDRAVVAGRVVRLHQEDLCQALGRMPGAKYEQEGGPTFVDAFDLVRQTSAEPLADTRQLLRWLVFVVLAGNADAHAKNLSLLYARGAKARLAPFYDLVCTRAYPALDPFLAMGVAGQRDPGAVGRADWMSLAAAVGVGPRLVLAEVEEIAVRIPAAFEKVAAEHASRHGTTPIIDRIRQVVGKQCRRSLRLVRG
jgi:serine/threonine-protein kinase HipA